MIVETLLLISAGIIIGYKTIQAIVKHKVAKQQELQQTLDRRCQIIDQLNLVQELHAKEERNRLQATAANTEHTIQILNRIQQLQQEADDKKKL